MERTRLRRARYAGTREKKQAESKRGGRTRGCAFMGGDERGQRGLDKKRKKKGRKDYRGIRLQITDLKKISRDWEAS